MGDHAVSKVLKKRWTSEGKGKSLKEFARELMAGGDKMAMEWLDNKKGAQNQERSDKNKKRIALEKQATKAARSKKGAKTKTKDTPAPAT